MPEPCLDPPDDDPLWEEALEWADTEMDRLFSQEAQDLLTGNEHDAIRDRIAATKYAALCDDAADARADAALSRREDRGWAHGYY